MIDGSSACRTIVGSVVTIWPATEVTTRFIGITKLTASNPANSPVNAYRVRRSWAGSGPSLISAVSD